VLAEVRLPSILVLGHELSDTTTTCMKSPQPAVCLSQTPDVTPSHREQSPLAAGTVTLGCCSSASKKLSTMMASSWRLW